ncbi:hypothetical protein CO115_02760 [Candidatus Falkowbacteria bacterium CG_4_9_14_3_um_filter_36_9]|nr:MAG: hypothetical protein COZ73_00515 [Candidatus Falkowbacteria bacterium CG_4_8_14_3_um_filter_36_11]PJA11096.1 MAG: hypothetical protein COX67_01595 [Candidatus Falkowbacteria bacterium CG_4_10_14_0_2_um_filter_36_22]PJB19540.1 MAG: hypothetical protein CO115_02760 [Candidatus Falkowbacteria bacterium CG_4_9_14_3_um_filter_36_9]
MNIVIDLTSFNEFANQSIDKIMLDIFLTVGWIPIAIVFLWGAKELWLFYIRKKWTVGIKYILLAIDIPRGNEQTPKAVENMFSYLAGAHSSAPQDDLIKKYWEGEVQLSFSMEIVSIDGYTQFLIHTPLIYRNLVESAVYSQYSDAEITEVNDYTEGLPTRFPDDEYDVWGAEFIQKRNSAYPIKTYKEFEHQLDPEGYPFKDTMATLMDLCSSLIKGEQLWYQIIIIPIGFDWPDIYEREVNKILGENHKGTWGNKIIDHIMNLITFISQQIYKLGEDSEIKKDEKDDVLKMINLKPKEKKQVEAIYEKVSKLGFECKIRMVYLAKKDVMNKPKVVNGFVGFIKQFATLDLNNIKPDMDRTATSVSYLFKEGRLNRRKNNIVRNYIRRDNKAGRRPGILNIEELATLWHFPVESAVKAPLIQKTPGKKGEPPMSLPVSEEIVTGQLNKIIANEEKMNLAEEIKKSENKNNIFRPNIPRNELNRTMLGEDNNDLKIIKNNNPPANLPFA